MSRYYAARGGNQKEGQHMFPHTVEVGNPFDRKLDLLEELQRSVSNGTCREHTVFSDLICRAIECGEADHLRSWLDLSSLQVLENWRTGVDLLEPVLREHKIVTIVFFLRHWVSASPSELH